MSQGYFDVSEHIPNNIFMPKLFFRALGLGKDKFFIKNGQKLLEKKRDFLLFFREKFSFLEPESAQK